MLYKNFKWFYKFCNLAHYYDVIILLKLNTNNTQTKQRLRQLGQGERAILFLENCSAHPSEDELMLADGKITAEFLQSLLQPNKN